MFSASEQFLIGGFLGYDMFLSGSGKVSATYQDIDGNEQTLSASVKLKSFDQTTFGVRSIFNLSKSLFLGADVGMGSGGYAVQEASSGVKFSSTQFSGFLGMAF